MRPLELQIEGFTSFRQYTTLDFADLNLFAITGSNGAGKSSLLDAITFALYGNTNKLGGRQLDALISQGASSLFVSFRFEVRQIEYRAVRTRSGKKSNFSLEERRQNDWILLEDSERKMTERVESLLRMDFKTFTRVILLPQGSFDEFLKGDGSTRRKILVQLAGIEIYEEMRKEAVQQNKDLKKERESLQSQLDSGNFPTPADIAIQEARLEELQQRIPDLEAQEHSAQQTLTQAQTLLERLTTLQHLQAQLETFEERTPEVLRWRQQLQLAQTIQHLRPQWELLTDSRQQVQAATEALQAAEKALTHATEQWQASQDHHRALLQQDLEIQERKTTLDTAATYHQQLLPLSEQIQALTAQSPELKQALEQAQQSLLDTQATLHSQQNDLATLTATIGDPGDRTRLESLQRIQPLLADWQRYQAEAQELDIEYTTLTAQLHQTQQHYESVQTQLSHLSTQYTALRAEIHEVEQTHAVARIRATLHDGDPCPVCSNPFPDPASFPTLSVTKGLEDLHNSEYQLQQQRDQIQAQTTQLQTTLAHRQESLIATRQKITLLQTQQANLVAQILTQLATDLWDPDTWEQERQRLEQHEHRRQAALVQQQQLTAQIDKARLSQDYQQREFQRLTADWQKHQSHLESLTTQQKIVGDQLKALLGADTYPSAQAAFDEQERTWQAALQSSQQQIQETQTTYLTAQAQQKVAHTTLQTALAAQITRQQVWDQALHQAQLSESDFQSQFEVDPQEWEQRINSHERELAILQQQIQSLNAEIAGRTIDSEQVENHRQRVASLRQQHREALVESGQLQQSIQNALEKLQQAGELREKLGQIEAEEDSYRILADDLKAQNFQSYLLNHLQADLVTQANLKLTDLSDSRYTLSLDGDDFWVEDNWNGGEARSVKTLSGGELFAASLAMALALSERLARDAEIGCLFLDEGFGTLDPETLEGVIQILMTLQQQERMIGIITHVASLASQMPAQIRIEKSPAGSRLVMVS